ncbi:MAG: DUF4132 domain-containing protein [Polyangiaceae bacterium]
MDAEAELIEAIERDPDDESGYAVYGDFLQSRGDPRGDLIALHRAPKKGRAAEQVLAAHRARLLGPLAEHEGQVKLEWQLGFIRRARVVADDEARACEIVKDVILSPSSRFLRRLEVSILGREPRYDAVEACLIELARPSTLDTIELGKGKQHRLSPELSAAFPRLQIAPSWDKTLAATKQRRRSNDNPLSAALPALRQKDGSELPLEDVALLRALGAEVDKKEPLGLVTQLRATCSASALDEYSAGLVKLWQRRRDASNAWVLDVAAALGGPATAHTIGRHIADVSHQRAVHSLEVLGTMETPLATLEIFAVTRLWSSRGEHAERVLANRAAAGSVTPHRLLAQTGANRPAGLHGPIAERFRELDASAVELLMTTGWSTTIDEARKLFLDGPRALSSLLFCQSSAPTKRGFFARLFGRAVDAPLCSAFRLAPDGGLDCDGRPVVLDPSAPISIVHPSQLAPEERERWRIWQEERLPPFPQMTRSSPLSYDAEPTLKAIKATLTSFPSFAAVRARGFRNAGQKDEEHRETQLGRTFVFRGEAYVFGVDFETRELVASQSRLPRVVAFEAARELGFAVAAS